MPSTLPAGGAAFDPVSKSAKRNMINPPPGSAVRRSPFADKMFGWLAQGAAWLTLLLLIAILLSLIVGAWPAISKYGLGFLTSTTWDPVKNEYGGLVIFMAR